MKLKDWIEYNKELWNGDLIVRALKAGSWKTNDLLFETVLRRDRAKAIFGEYEIKKFCVDQYPDLESCTIRVLIWIENID